MRGRVTVALVVLLATRSAPAAAQLGGLLRIPGGSAEAGVQFDGQRLRTGGDPATSGEMRYWFALPLAGAAGGPGLMSWSLTLRPVFQQRSQSSYASPLASRSLDLSGGVRLFGAQPLNVTGDAMRATGFSQGGFGSRRDFATTSTRAGLWWSNRVMPMQVAWSSRASDDRWTPTPAAPVVRTEQVQRTQRFTAASSKTAVEWQRVVVDDRVAGSLHAWTGTVTHTLRWGRGSRLESSWEGSGQRGFVTAGRRAWTERLHLDHGRVVTTDHRLNVSSLHLRGQASRSSGWSSDASVRLARAVSAGLGIARYATRADTAHYELLVFTPRGGASLALPSRWRLATSASVALERRITAGAPDRVQPVVDEPHPVPPIRTFLLEQRAVDEASVAIRSADGTFVYEEGLDYALGAFGTALQVIVSPGSRIAVGETVLVNYRYYVPVAARATGTRLEYEVSLSRPGLQLRHRRHLRRGGDPSAALAGTGVFDESRTDVDLRTRTAVGALAVDASVRHGLRDGPATTEWGAGVSLAPPAFGRATSSVGMHWNRSHSEGITADALAGSAGVAWAVAPTLSATTGLEIFRWDQNGVVQRFVSGHVGANWSPGATTVSLRFDLHQREFVTRNVEARASAQLVRHF